MCEYICLICKMWGFASQLKYRQQKQKKVKILKKTDTEISINTAFYFDVPQKKKKNRMKKMIIELKFRACVSPSQNQNKRKLRISVIKIKEIPNFATELWCKLSLNRTLSRRNWIKINIIVLSRSWHRHSNLSTREQKAMFNRSTVDESCNWDEIISLRNDNDFRFSVVFK